MVFLIAFTASAVADIAWFSATERQEVMDGIADRLAHQPDVETRNRKRLRPNATAEWELRLGPFRVFYDVSAAGCAVSVLMVGRKHGSVLRVRGKEFMI
ncbi:MAG: hypothetical protein NT029_00630 [Armatimonadetes bacterium]|nr:hypothetical protein [Armatimonadota bacterium]